ncbi:hypothetical protein LV779_39710 [Streptomyces thinghirensis]|nr:hypothetical protein [Streptomyces thinghirensis]
MATAEDKLLAQAPEGRAVDAAAPGAHVGRRPRARAGRHAGDRTGRQRQVADRVDSFTRVALSPAGAASSSASSSPRRSSSPVRIGRLVVELSVSSAQQRPGDRPPQTP